jgi:NAD(P)-dependent dehydrogenase (short-subunit alcohol dehydrogenase family)
VSADRSGIDTLMKNLAIEWGHHGIRVYSIVPGPIEGTEGMKRLADPSQEDRFVDAVRLRQWAEPGRLGTVQHGGREDAADAGGACPRLNQIVLEPPFRAMVCPVYQLASFDASQATAAPTSSGVPARPTAVVFLAISS